MVRTAGELEGKYGGHGGRHGGDLRYGVEYQCQPRGQVQDAGAGQILSKSVVSELAPGLSAGSFVNAFGPVGAGRL